MSAAVGTNCVINPRRGIDLEVFPFLLCLGRRAVAKIIWVHGIDQQPYDPLGREFLLQRLRGAAVLIMTKRAIRIIGFNDHNLALVIRELDGLAVDVRAGEVGGRLANFHRECRGGDRQCCK